MIVSLPLLQWLFPGPLLGKGKRKPQKGNKKRTKIKKNKIKAKRKERCVFQDRAGVFLDTVRVFVVFLQGGRCRMLLLAFLELGKALQTTRQYECSVLCSIHFLSHREIQPVFPLCSRLVVAPRQVQPTLPISSRSPRESCPESSVFQGAYLSDLVFAVENHRNPTRFSIPEWRRPRCLVYALLK